MAEKCKTANDVKHFLHGNVFHPKKQRIIGFIQVSKKEPSKNPLKKKENRHYLCLFVNAGKPYQPCIARYIKSADGKSFELRRLWGLEEMTRVDGKTDQKSGSFVLWFGHPFKFEAATSQDRDKFIDELAESFKKYLDKIPPDFVNVNTKVKQEIQKAGAEKSQLEKTRQELAERGDKLSDVEQKTSEMARSSETFARNAHKLAEHYQ